MNMSLIKQYGHIALSDLPRDIRFQVDADPDTLAWFKRTEQLTQALQIKNHEMPSDASMSRMEYAINTRIANMSPSEFEAAQGETRGKWLPVLQPVLKFGLATCLTVLAIYGISKQFGMQQTGPTPTLVTNPDAINPVVTTNPNETGLQLIEQQKLEEDAKDAKASLDSETN